jgi:hypothetical protein
MATLPWATAHFDKPPLPGATLQLTIRLLPLLLTLATGAVVVTSRPAAAFSVLAHQEVVDASWKSTLVPALRARFPGVGADQLEHAHAFAYGGSHVADLGYFPLGSRQFTDLLHYVRTGDLISTLLADAATPDEYAFALGALAHYVADSIGHPETTNRVVPEIYPKLRKKYGDVVTYADDHGAHLQTEFRFDVFQMTRSHRTPDLLDHTIGFEVAEPLLDRAFVATYGLHLDDLFTSTDVAIATYRWGFRALIHEATGIAWELYRADIEQLNPDITPAAFLSDLSRSDFEHEFGKAYREPGYFAKFFALLAKLVPNVGPFKRMPYRPLPAHARQLFIKGLDDATAHYRADVGRLREHRLTLTDVNLDTGHPTRGGAYEPADEAYAALLEKLDERHFTGMSPALRADILRYYQDPQALTAMEKHTCKRERERVRQALARLEATRPAERAGGAHQR